jgi:site-specific DNA recombinase
VTRAVVYARFSTDLQSDKSTEDQIDLCRAYAKREGFEIVGEFFDKAISGATMHRPGMQDMLHRVRAGGVDIILCEELDRLSRDMGDLASLHRDLGFRGVRLWTVHGGEAKTLDVGMRGLFAQLFREDNVHKVRRGMSGLIKDGKSAGGRAYGYRPDPLDKGVLHIVPEEAEIVQRIFAEYAEGKSPRHISHDLNAERVPAPRGKLWQPSALIGMAERGSGLLRNSIYVGKPTWNKNRMVKDPATGKRISRPNPKEDWQTADVPELRILPEALFEAVQAQMASRAQPSKLVNGRRPMRLLSGLLECGACGSGMAVAGVDKSGRTRLRCSAHTGSRSCPDPQTFYLADVEALVIDSLTQELATADRVRAYAQAYMEKRHAEAARESRRRHEIDARLKHLQKENERLVRLMMQDGADEKTLGAMTKANGQERDALEAELARLPRGATVTVLPSAIDAFATKLAAARPKLEMALHMLDEFGELSRLIRDVVDSVTIYRDKEDKRLVIKVTAHLDMFTVENSVGAAKVVAEEGLEPPTRGL